MNFDSTTYLAYNLKDKLNLEISAIDNCIKLLDGTIINPGSIKYDEEKREISFSATLPDNEMIMKKIIIDRSGEIHINLSLKNLLINVEYGLYTFTKRYSLLCDEKGKKYSGIYYYDDLVFRGIKDCNFDGMYSYYDAETLKTLENKYMPEFMEKGITLDSVLGNNSETINNLGFVPDLTKWENRHKNKDENDKRNVYEKLNDEIKALNYNQIIEKLSNFHQEYTSSINPVTYKK